MSTARTSTPVPQVPLRFLVDLEGGTTVVVTVLSRNEVSFIATELETGRYGEGTDPRAAVLDLAVGMKWAWTAIRHPDAAPPVDEKLIEQRGEDAMRRRVTRMFVGLVQSLEGSLRMLPESAATLRQATTDELQQLQTYLRQIRVLVPEKQDR